MSKTLKKLIVCICIILTISNFLYGSRYICMAEELDVTSDDFKTALEEDSIIYDDDDGDKTVLDWVTEICGGIAGILLWQPRLYSIIGIGVIQSVITAVGMSAGLTPEGDEASLSLLTPYQILFNHIMLTDIDFFSIPAGEDSVIITIREQIALWYYIVRFIAMTILLGILIFVGIKMAITTVASEKAIYKKALFDWATSLALVFLLHYIIIGILWINKSLVRILAGIGEGVGLENLLEAMAGLLFDFNVFTAIAATAVYLMILIQTLMFLIHYIKRLLILAFLIIISPLITITYAIDKMGDQKAQALNTWLKEFTFNILIQPFHCILYLAFVNTALVALSGHPASIVGNTLVAILAIKFVWDGEKIVKKIFGFEQASSLAAAAASGAVVASMLNKAKGAGSVAKNGVKFAKSTKTGQLLNQKFKDSRFSKEGRDRKRAMDAFNADPKNKNNKLTSNKYKNLSDEEKKKVDKKVKEMKATPKAKNKVAEKYNELKAKNPWVAAIGADAKKFTRKMMNPEKAAKYAAAAMIGTAMYTLPDQNLFTAVGAGYAAGKGAEKGVKNLRENKKEHFEENVLKAWNRHCDIKGISQDDRTREKFDNWYKSTYLKGKNMDAYSDKSMNKTQKEAEKDLAKLGLSSGDIDTIVARIQKSILEKEKYDPNKLYSGFKDSDGKDVKVSEIEKAMSDFADKYNESYTYMNGDAYNEQMNQFGVTDEEALAGISDSEFAKPKTAPTSPDTPDAPDTPETVTTTTVKEEEVIENMEEHIDEAKADMGEDADPGVLLDRLQDIINDKIITLQNDIRTNLEEIGNDQEKNLDKLMNDLNSQIDNINLSNGDVGGQITSAINSAMSNINLDGISEDMQSQLITNIKRYATTRVENNYVTNNTTGTSGGLDPDQIKRDLTDLLKNSK